MSESRQNYSVPTAQQTRSVMITSALSAEGSQFSLADSTSKVKAEASFLERRRMFHVIVDKIDLTPDDILDPSFKTMDETYQQAAFESKTRAKDDLQYQMAKSKSRMALAAEQSTMKVFATTINLDDIHIDHTLDTEAGLVGDDADLEQAPSAFHLPKMATLTSYPPEILVTLKETETCFLFEQPCNSYEKETPEGNAIEEENEYYEYITVGKGKNRKKVNEETQTNEVITQSRHTLAVRAKKKNAASFASLWDMYDTYARLAQEREPPAADEMVLYQSAAPTMLRKKKRKVVQVSHIEGKTFDDIATTSEFLDAVMIMERVLSSLEYNDAQKTFRGLIKMDPLSLDLVYIYTMKPLWTFECPETANKAIISMSFNPQNENILAVAHGKFAYAENCKGMVCIWSTKNPCKPERIYHFDCPLTSISFSHGNPNWLACGFWNGDVIILDITSHTIKTMATSHRDTNPCFDPIWVTDWRTIDRNFEYVMTACEDGRINRFTSTKTHEFICAPVMRVSVAEGKLKGIETAKACLKNDVPITRHPAVLCMIWHPTISHVYMVGTSMGCLHRCSTHYLNQHIDVFRAHDGPVYDIQICPYQEYLYITAGADNAVRLWIEGMDDVIITLTCKGAVHGVAFCPINTTIIVTVSGHTMSVWDIRRKTHIPCAEYDFPGNVVLTYVHFSSSGHNVFVCDTSGKIHTFHLEDAPIPAFYQRVLLDEAIRVALCTRPHMLKHYEKLKKIRELHNKI